MKLGEFPTLAAFEQSTFAWPSEAKESVSSGVVVSKAMFALNEANVIICGIASKVRTQYI